MRYLIPLLFIANIQAADLSKYIKVKLLAMEFEKAVLTNRSTLSPRTEPIAGYMNLRFNLDIGSRVYFDNKVLSEYTNKQFRGIAWNPEVGYKLFKGIDVYFKHYSGHTLDLNTGEKFPENNSIGVRFTFIEE